LNNQIFSNMENKRGGAREGAGRKPKADEVAMIEKLSPMQDKAYEALEKGVEAGDFKFVQLYFNYYAGKPKETKDITLNNEQPIFSLGDF
jgi:hypothetical protein